MEEETKEAFPSQQCKNCHLNIRLCFKMPFSYPSPGLFTGHFRASRAHALCHLCIPLFLPLLCPSFSCLALSLRGCKVTETVEPDTWASILALLAISRMAYVKLLKLANVSFMSKNGHNKIIHRPVHQRSRVGAVIWCLLRAMVLVFPASRSVGCQWSIAELRPRHRPWCRVIVWKGLPVPKDWLMRRFSCLKWGQSQRSFQLHSFLGDQQRLLLYLPHSSASHSPTDAPVNLKGSVSEPVFNLKKVVKRKFSAYQMPRKLLLFGE